MDEEGVGESVIIYHGFSGISGEVNGDEGIGA